ALEKPGESNNRAVGDRTGNPDQMGEYSVGPSRADFPQSRGGLDGEILLVRILPAYGPRVQCPLDGRDTPGALQLTQSLRGANAHREGLGQAGLGVAREEKGMKDFGKTRVLADAQAASCARAYVRMMAPQQPEKGSSRASRAQTVEGIGTPPLDLGIRLSGESLQDRE